MISTYVLLVLVVLSFTFNPYSEEDIYYKILDSLK